MKQDDPSGMLLVMRNNWPFYMAGTAVALTGFGAVIGLELPRPLEAVSLAGAVASLYWVVASLAASCWIYDLSGLYRMSWLQPHLRQQPGRTLNLHAGLDLTSQPLRRLRPQDSLLTADIYDPASMTEGSIRRARRIGGSPLSIRRKPKRIEDGETRDSPCLLRLQADQMPFGDESFEVVYLLLAAHEVRSRTARCKLFREVQRILKPEGRAVLVEHLRDIWNLAAFGPGFLHFLSRRQWSDALRRSGLENRFEACLTPFLRLWILQKSCSRR